VLIERDFGIMPALHYLEIVHVVGCAWYLNGLEVFAQVYTSNVRDWERE
jgi:hypothetical protein